MRKLYRSLRDRKIAGVCGGIAVHIDSTIVRIIFLLFLFGEGAGLMVYIIAWIIVPER